MSYKKLSNGKHRWDFRLGEKRFRYTDTDFKRGSNHVKEMQVDYERGSSEVYSNETLHSILDHYLADKTAGKPPNKCITINSNIRCLKRLLPNSKLSWFNQKDKQEYNAISQWFEHYRDKPAAGNRKFNTLRAAFGWAIRKGFSSENPCRRVSKLAEKRPFPRYLERTEIQALLKASPRQEFTDYCTLILETGMRPEEALSLKWENVDLDRRTLYILDQKNGSKSAVGISDRLAEWFKKREVTDKRVLEGYTYWMLKVDAPAAIKAANLPRKPGCGRFTIYGLRHTFASHLLMAGVKIEAVAKLLRHKDINTTYKHYGHLTQDYLREPVDKLNLMGDFLHEVSDQRRGS